jgi:hypothetical protein
MKFTYWEQQSTALRRQAKSFDQVSGIVRHVRRTPVRGDHQLALRVGHLLADVAFWNPT